MKNKSYIFFLLIITFLIGCNQKQPNDEDYKIEIGGPCIFEKKSQYVYISNYTKNENDSIIDVKFSTYYNLFKETNEFDSKDILRAGGKIFDNKTIEDSTWFFEVIYEKEIRGTCEPIHILNIRKVKL